MWPRMGIQNGMQQCLMQCMKLNAAAEKGILNILSRSTNLKAVMVESLKQWFAWQLWTFNGAVKGIKTDMHKRPSAEHETKCSR